MPKSKHKAMPKKSALKRSDVNTLFSVFKSRVDRTPKDEAFRFYDKRTENWQSISWIEAYQEMIRVRNALAKENCQMGDRVMLVMDNGPSWIYIEQAALYMGLILVALPANLPPANICQLAKEVGAKIIFIASDNIWHTIHSNPYIQTSHTTVICASRHNNIQAAIYFDQWVQKGPIDNIQMPASRVSESALATIIFTSGSCGKPKGVKHNHKNIINNAFACLERIDVNAQDKMLSITPISHCLERIAGYYVPMIAGASIVFPKSTETILEDLAESEATILITTPHRLEKAYKRLLDNLAISSKLVDQYLNYLHSDGKWRLKFLFWPTLRGIIEKKTKKLLLHQLRFVICGGSALSPKIISLSNFLNLPVLQGYGLTEAGGVVATNSIKQNMPFSVGKPLKNTQIRLSDSNELLIQSDSLMLGYWQDGKPNLQANHWLKTKDLARLENNYIFIEGRKNQSIHLSTGITVLPLPIEQKLTQDVLFDNALLFGENKEYLSLFCQLNLKEWQGFRKKYAKNREKKSDDFTKRLKSILLIRVNTILGGEPFHQHIHLIFPTLEDWYEENGLLNTQGKINREMVEKFYANDIQLLE